MVECVVGPMPAKEFLKLLPAPRNSEKRPTFDEEPFAKSVDQKTEPQMYNPFVRIPFSFLYQIALNIFPDRGDERFLPQPRRRQYLQYPDDNVPREGY